MSGIRYAWLYRATAGERWWLRATVVTAVVAAVQFIAGS